MSEFRKIVVVLGDPTYEEWVEITDVQGLATLVQGREYGDYDIAGVYALDGYDLVKVDWSVAVGPFNENDFATGMAKVAFPDGHGEIGYYQIDGAS